jgi:hypothetical protein
MAKSIFLTQPEAGGLNLSARALLWIFGHRPKRQKHIGALIGALATGCKASGLYGKKPLLATNYMLLFALD